MITLWHNRNSETARCVNTERPLTHSLDLGEEGLAMQATRTCSVEGCERAAKKREWCNAHYRRWLRHGDPAAGRRAPVGGPCSVEGCERPHRSGGFCNMHGLRVRHHGDPHHVEAWIPPPPRSGSASPNWAGGDASYSAVHYRLNRSLGPASDHRCRHCGARAAHWAYDKTDPNESVDSRGCTYSHEPARYMPLCISCHWRFDGAAKRLPHPPLGGESNEGSI